jgi:hypothetical protein
MPLVSECLEFRLYFVSILTLSLFDCLEEGIATLFVFGHVSGHLALVKSSGSHFQCCANAAIDPRFLVWECLIVAVGTTSQMHLLFVNVVVRLNAEHIPIHVIDFTCYIVFTLPPWPFFAFTSVISPHLLTLYIDLFILYY